MNYSIKEIVKDRQVNFLRYRKESFTYWIELNDGVYIFPVPLDDIGDATLKSFDKAIYFMRYIRKALNEGTFVKMGSHNK